MKGDFSRETFDKNKHFSSVRMQQGRVQLDADWNEQMAIWNHRIQTETNDFIGDSGTPAGEHNGYAVTIKTTTAESQTQYHLNITKGRYYVNGLLVENEQDVSYTTQIDYPKATLPTNDGLYLAYLDVWQQGISGAEDASIEEPALGGADTTTRIKNIAQVKLLALDKTGVSQPTCTHLFDKTSTLTSVKKNITTWNGLINPSHQGKMQARTNTAPNLKNQLYRIEIHQSGTENKATFKWSRDNGATVVPIATISGNIINIKSAENLILSFKAKQWVELNTHQRILQGKTGIFVQLLRVEKSQLTITLWPSGVNPSEFINGTLRLWNVNPTLLSQSPFTLLDTTKTTLDKGKTVLTLSEGEDKQGTLLKTLLGKSIELTNQSFITQKKKGYLFVVETVDTKQRTITVSDTANIINEKKLDRFIVIKSASSTIDVNDYLLLENGLEIKFTAGNYKTGDYWLIPTRAITNKIDSKLLTPQLPIGAKHYYTKLALIEKTGSIWKWIEDCRTIFSSLSAKVLGSTPQSPSDSILVDKDGKVDINKGNLNVKKDFTVTGKTQISSLQVDGATELKKGVTVTGETKTTSLTASGKTTTKTLQVDGNASFESVTVKSTSSDTAVYGKSSKFGVFGDSVHGTGVRAQSASSYGVYADSNGGTGIEGRSSTGKGIIGFTEKGTHAFYASKGGYGPFTGSHEALIATKVLKNIKEGMLLSITGKLETRLLEIGKKELSSTLPTVNLSTVANDSKVIGVFSSIDIPAEGYWYKLKANEKLVSFNALGDGLAWVSNINGNIKAGDYITTSKIPGYGMKQSDDFLHSYTLGKAMQDINWDKVTETIKLNGKSHKIYLIGIIYTSG